MDYREIIDELINKNITFGSIESLTGGLFASTVTSYSGVSKVYKGSVVTYATCIKEDVVGVSKEEVKNHGVVSSEVAYEMALKGKKLLNVDLCVSFTGNAGPDVMENKEAGLVYIGVAYKDEVETFKLHLKETRNEIREECVKFAFEQIKIKII